MGLWSVVYVFFMHETLFFEMLGREMGGGGKIK